MWVVCLFVGGAVTGANRMVVAVALLTEERGDVLCMAVTTAEVGNVEV